MDLQNIRPRVVRVTVPLGEGRPMIHPDHVQEAVYNIETDFADMLAALNAASGISDALAIWDKIRQASAIADKYATFAGDTINRLEARIERERKERS